MKIEIICRVRYPELFNRMRDSAKKNAIGPVKFSTTLDDGHPHLADSYNLLGAVSNADILVFVHDDVEFLSLGWDDKLRDGFALGFNVLGVVGSSKYEGGMVFDAGKQYSVGKMVGIYEGKRRVKLMVNRSDIEPAAVVDGMFLAVKRDHFAKIGGFDDQFAGLFYYDLDFCLRSNCAVVDILLGHDKPDHLRGIYPPKMRPMSDYDAAFNAKHGFKPDPPIGDQHCDSMLYEDYIHAAVLA